MSNLHRSKSGKKGSLMDVINDPDYGIDTRGTFKGKYFMNTAREEVELPEVSMEGTAEDFTPDHVYNRELTVLDSTYTYPTMVLPNDLILVRLLMRPYKINGIYTKPMLYKPLKSGAEGKGEPAEHPFYFYNAGVVVNAAKRPGADTIPAGVSVQVRPEILRPIFNRETWQFELPPVSFSRFDRQDIGYVLVRYNDIQAIFN